MTPDEKERRVYEEKDLAERLGRPLSAQDRDLLEVVNAGLAQKGDRSTAQTATTGDSGGVVPAPGPASPAARQLVEALKAATEIAEELASTEQPTAVELQTALRRLTPLLQAIAHAANQLVDLSLREALPERERPK